MLLALILISVSLAAIAQLTLKHGMNQVVDRVGPILGDRSEAEFKLSGASIRAVLTTPAVWVGLSLFGLSAVVWLAVLSGASLSFAYPFAALTYVLIVLFDKFILHDPVPLARWGGVALIVAGIVLVARTPHA